MTTVWSRAVKGSDGVQFEEGFRQIYDPRADLEILYFQGFHSGLLHFEYHEVEDGLPRVQDFKFDYPPTGGLPVYGVRGKIFEVVHVDDTRMSYWWIAIP